MHTPDENLTPRLEPRARCGKRDLRHRQSLLRVLQYQPENSLKGWKTVLNYD
ncbi:hypothetical protein SAMN04488005_1252 [Yoonia tamlensis]|uniref:Uncharacterized protein n=1 Tax=Yoonia tamlensis TaxID=390270 RepID=A0A1I6G8N3_9RHOB|nr:hypothetical protein SAMN04488005_1252 [Yoonia tamlensis]